MVKLDEVERNLLKPGGISSHGYYTLGNFGLERAF